MTYKQKHSVAVVKMVLMSCVGQWRLGSTTMYLESGSWCVSSMLTLHADFCCCNICCLSCYLYLYMFTLSDCNFCTLH